MRRSRRRDREPARQAPTCAVSRRGAGSDIVEPAAPRLLVGAVCNAGPASHCAGQPSGTRKTPAAASPARCAGRSASDGRPRGLAQMIALKVGCGGRTHRGRRAADAVADPLSGGRRKRTSCCAAMPPSRAAARKSRTPARPPPAMVACSADSARLHGQHPVEGRKRLVARSRRCADQQAPPPHARRAAIRPPRRSRRSAAGRAPGIDHSREQIALRSAEASAPGADARDQWTALSGSGAPPSQPLDEGSAPGRVAAAGRPAAHDAAFGGRRDQHREEQVGRLGRRAQRDVVMRERAGNVVRG